MNGYEQVVAKQVAWARNRGIALVGSKGSRGRLAYTPNLDQNLFLPLLPDVRASFDAADGGELGKGKYPGKMQAVHSSSALGVNVFQYWKAINAVPMIAAACGFCRWGNDVSKDIVFEDKYEIDPHFGYHPNIDVVVHNAPSAKYRVFAIECKFTEAYGAQMHGGVDPKYFNCKDRDGKDLWGDIPELLKFAKSISPDDKHFRYLHAAQLAKHILGLKRKFGRDGFRLLYLWYDVFGDQGAKHREEIGQFASVAKAAGTKFHSMSYQELFLELEKHLRDQHYDYVRYLAERY